MLEGPKGEGRSVRSFKEVRLLTRLEFRVEQTKERDSRVPEPDGQHVTDFEQSTENRTEDQQTSPHLQTIVNEVTSVFSLRRSQR